MSIEDSVGTAEDRQPAGWSNDASDGNRQWWGPVAGVIGLVLAVLGVFAVVSIATSGDDTTAPSQTTPADPGVAVAGQSICGLNDGEPGQPITGPPAATWLYSGSGTTAYPTSPRNGPGATATAGYRYCFPHTTEGALFAAANLVALPPAAQARAAWLDYFMGEGPGSQQAQPGSDASNDARIKIVGFQILDATADTARVDIAVEASGTRTVNAAAVYELVWEDGDWKLNGTVEKPVMFTVIPDTSGYTPWGP